MSDAISGLVVYRLGSIGKQSEQVMRSKASLHGPASPPASRLSQLFYRCLEDNVESRADERGLACEVSEGSRDSTGPSV